MQTVMMNRARELLAGGTVSRVIGWKRGETDWDITPAVFTTVSDLEAGFVYNDLCSSNLSKYLVRESRKEGRTLVFLKPCDSYSFNQLLKEHRIASGNVLAVGVPCDGKIDREAISAKGLDGITVISPEGGMVRVETLYGGTVIPREEAISARCAQCKSRKHVYYDELLGNEGEVLDSHRFDMVARIEAMDPDSRYAFWRGELSRCIRCNACRNVCPACTCERCVFDNDASGVANKAAGDPFEENLFHVIRAFHVAGRCTDCGECSRVCPQNIPLHLLNRKMMKDSNELYGEYQAGADAETPGPLTAFSQGDAEPSVVYGREGRKN